MQDYKVVWNNPVIEGDLFCEREVGNPHNMHTVAVRRFSSDGNLTVVGDIPS